LLYNLIPIFITPFLRTFSHMIGFAPSP
jgi:hypothetical protein